MVRRRAFARSKARRRRAISVNAREPTCCSRCLARTAQHALRMVSTLFRFRLAMAREAHRDRASDFGRVPRAAAFDRRVSFFRRIMAGALAGNARRRAAPTGLAASVTEPFAPALNWRRASKQTIEQSSRRTRRPAVPIVLRVEFGNVGNAQLARGPHAHDHRFDDGKRHA